MRILIVDDSKAMRMIVKRTLRQAGFESHTTEEANNGQEALAMVKTSPPDVILLDWNMPEMTGLDVALELQKAGSPVKYGFVTSEGTTDMMEQAKAAGSRFFITKPFTPELFQQVLSEVLS